MDPNDPNYIHPHPPYTCIREYLNAQGRHTLSPGIFPPPSPNSFWNNHDSWPAGESEREVLSMIYPPRVTALTTSSQTIPTFHTSSLTQAANGSSVSSTQSLAEHSEYRYQESRNDIDSPEVHRSQPHTTPWNTQALPDGGTYVGELDTMVPITYRQPLVDPTGPPPDIDLFIARLGRGLDSMAFQRLSGYLKMKNDQQLLSVFRIAGGGA